MHIHSLEIGIFLVIIGVVHATLSVPSSVVEVALVFPQNKTYAPTSIFPIVFGIKNPKLAGMINPIITFDLRDWNDISHSIPGLIENDLLHSANLSSTDTTYFSYRSFERFNTEGTWRLVWGLGWSSCAQSSGYPPVNVVQNWTQASVTFTIKNDASEVDLTAVNDACSEDKSFSFEVHDNYSVPIGLRKHWDHSEMCGTAVPSNTTSDKPCPVQIDSAAASSISASMTNEKCNVRRPDAKFNCPPKESAAQREISGDLKGLALVFGVLSYVLI